MDNRPSYRDKYSIIIPAAGIGRRMRIHGPKSLIPIQGGKTILSNQLENIKECFRHYEIVLIGGYQIDKLTRDIPKNTKIIYNKNYEKTNVLDSIRLGLEEITTDKVIILYGDLIFNKNCLNLPFYNSSAIVICNTMQKEEVGCIIENNTIENMFYQLPNKWAQISYFTGFELYKLKNLCNHDNYRMWFGFEAINTIISMGGKFEALKPEDGRAIDIDSSYDLKYYNENFN